MELRLENAGSWWLWLLLAAALFSPCLFFLNKRKARISSRALFDDTMYARLTVSLNSVRRFWRQALLTLAVFLALLALARPRGGWEKIPEAASNLNIVIALDVSRSMLAADAVPSRLEVGKWLAEKLVEARSGDRFALVPFAGKAFIEVPLTLDREMLYDVIGRFSTDTIPLQGTSIQSALREARRALSAGDDESGAVVLISDGEELQGDSRAEAAALEECDVPVFTIALGKPEISSFIRLSDGAFLRDNNGAVVSTRVNEQLMRELAFITNGRYWLSTEKSYDLANQLIEAVGSFQPASVERNSIEQPVEYFQLPLALAVLLLLAGFLIGERRRHDKISGGCAGRMTGIFFCAAAIFHLSTPSGAGGGIIFSTGAGGLDSDRYFEDGSLKYAGRRQKVHSSLEPKLAGWYYYGTGRIHQLIGDPGLAREAYRAALVNSGEDEQLRGMSLWNLGMIAHLEGQWLMTRSPASAARLLEQARQKYVGAMTALGANAKLAGNQEILIRDRYFLHRISAGLGYDEDKGQWRFMVDVSAEKPEMPLDIEKFDFSLDENLLPVHEENEGFDPAFPDEEKQGEESVQPKEPFADADSKPVEWFAEEELDSALVKELVQRARRREKNLREIIKRQYFNGMVEPEKKW